MNFSKLPLPADEIIRMENYLSQRLASLRDPIGVYCKHAKLFYLPLNQHQLLVFVYVDQWNKLQRRYFDGYIATYENLRDWPGQYPQKVVTLQLHYTYDELVKLDPLLSWAEDSNPGSGA